MDTEDGNGIDQHPDLRDLPRQRGFGPRARWQARRQRSRLRKQWRDPDTQRRQHWRTRLLIAGVVLLPIAAVATATYWDDITGKENTAESIHRIPPSSTPTKYVPNAAVQLHQPFVGTPAASWRDGLAGIRTPKPKSTGGSTAAEVKDAISAVRKSLRAAYLDRRVLVKHDVDVFLRTLAPDDRKRLGKRDAEDFVVRLHKDYPLLPASPKFKGTMSVRAGQPGELIVRTRFAVAYAFDTEAPGDLQGALDIVSVVNVKQDFRYYAGATWDRSSHGVFLGSTSGYTYSMNCEAAKDGYLAPYYSNRHLSEGFPEDDPDGYFDPEAPLERESNCEE